MKKNKLYIFILLIVSLNCMGQNNFITSDGGSYLSEDDDDNQALYAYGTILFTAINATTTTFNIMKWNKYDKYRSNAIFGIISGSLQTALGFSNVNATYKNAYIPTSVNIGVGLTTIVTSVIRLAKKNPPKENKMTYNLYYLPQMNPTAATVGFSIVRRLN